jgi:RNA chaperone Hfq
MNEISSEQESFLDRLIDARAPVSVFLINGIRLSGTIQSYDHKVVLRLPFRRSNRIQTLGFNHPDE